jgi:hypothetical protein
MKDKRLISSPIHAPNQEWEETEIKVPNIIASINKRCAGELKIKKRNKFHK